MRPFVKAHKGGWVAFSSIWAYLWGREPVLRARTWAAMRAALEGLQSREGRAVSKTARPHLTTEERKEG